MRVEVSSSSTINESLVRWVVAAIEASPDDWCQWSFGTTRQLIGLGERRYVRASCGSTMCFGGWALVLTETPVVAGNIGDAQRLLGLTDDQAEELFFWMDDIGPTHAVRVHKLKERITTVTGITFDDE